MSTTRLLRVAALVILCHGCIRAQLITTVAGTEFFFPTYSLPAVNAPLGLIQGVATDTKGNLYVADASNNIVVRVSPDGVLAVIAGNGAQGFAGDGGPAVSASLRTPIGVAVDPAGNLYIADSGNQRIRKVTPDGAISTLAGGPAANGQLNDPQGISVDPAGNLYVADTLSHSIRKVTPAGTISTVAGIGAPGFSGDGGPATRAALSYPYGIALDIAGDLYIADGGNSRIRKISPDGVINTVAGNGSFSFSGDGGPAISAALNTPHGVFVDATGNLYIADSQNERIRKVTAMGVISTVAGNASSGFSGDGGPAVSAQLLDPVAVAGDASGALYIADSQNRRVRKVASNGTISTAAGNASYRFSGDGGAAVNATLDAPGGAAVDATGNLYIADSLNHRIRKVAPSGVISTVAGTGIGGFSGDGGPAISAQLSGPQGVAVDSAGNLYIADTLNLRIRKVTPNGTITTVASTSLGFPTGVVVDSAGNLYIADYTSNRVRKVAPDGTITTLAGNGSQGFSGDGGPATNAQLYDPVGVAVDAARNVYIADSFNNRIRKVAPDGTITTVAGTGGAYGYAGDGGPATSAVLGGPGGVAVDAAGTLYIADTNTSRIRRVTPTGTISTVAGNGVAGYSGDGNFAISAALNFPAGVATDPAGNLFVADTLNNRIRELVPVSLLSFNAAPTSLTFSGITAGTQPPPQNINLTSLLAGLPFVAASDPWLSVTPSNGTTPATLQVSADPTTLAPGVYQGTIKIIYVPPGAYTGFLPTVNIAVTFTVQPAPPAKLSVSLQTLAFTVVQGGTPQTAQIQVQNAGGASLPFTAAATTGSGGNWLSVSPANGTATPASPASLTLTATSGTLLPGTYQGTVTVLGAGVTARVGVTLSVSAPSARILLSQSGLSFTAVAQGGSPLPQSFGILNIGQGSMDWSATASTLSGGSQWLQVSPASGTVARPYLDASLVNVTIDPTGLTAGDYYGRIQVSSSAANSPQLVTVILSVLPAGVSPGPEVRPAALIFTGLAGSTPGSQDVMLGNPKATADSFASGQIGNGFTYLPTNATVPSNQPTTVRVFPDFSQLQAGDIVRGVITLLFSDGTSRNVSVLTVVAPASSNAPGLGLEATGCSSPKLEIQFRSPAAQQSFAATLGKPTTIEVQVVDDCGTLVTNPTAATINATFSNKDSDLRLVHIGNGIWTGTWRPVNSATGRATISVTAFSSTGSVLQSGQNSVSGTLTAGLTPSVTAGGVVHAASDVAGIPIAPGSLITIYGSNLADGQGQSATLPLPQLQNGTQVLMGNQLLPILYTSDGQVNVQVPFSTPVNGQYQLSVQRDNLLSVPEQLVIAAAQPGVFTVNQQGSGQGVIFHSDGVTLAQTGRPASAGETVVIYCTGLGAVSPAVPEGTPPPSSPLSNTVNPVIVTIGGQPATISFSGLTPGFPGLYQVNAVVPKGVSGDAVAVQVTVASQQSPAVTMAVQ